MTECSLRLSLRSLRLCVEGNLPDFVGTKNGIRDVFFNAETQRTQRNAEKTQSGWRIGMTDIYVELHARSAFSFLEGSCVPEELAGACASLDMPAMALLDRNGVYGSPRFHMAAKKGRRAGAHR